MIKYSLATEMGRYATRSRAEWADLRRFFFAWGLLIDMYFLYLD